MPISPPVKGLNNMAALSSLLAWNSGVADAQLSRRLSNMVGGAVAVLYSDGLPANPAKRAAWIVGRVTRMFPGAAAVLGHGHQAALADEGSSYHDWFYPSVLALRYRPTKDMINVLGPRLTGDLAPCFGIILAPSRVTAAEADWQTLSGLTGISKLDHVPDGPTVKAYMFLAQLGQLLQRTDMDRIRDRSAHPWLRHLIDVAAVRDAELFASNTLETYASRQACPTTAAQIRATIDSARLARTLKTFIAARQGDPAILHGVEPDTATFSQAARAFAGQIARQSPGNEKTVTDWLINQELRLRVLARQTGVAIDAPSADVQRAILDAEPAYSRPRTDHSKVAPRLRDYVGMWRNTAMPLPSPVALLTSLAEVLANDNLTCPLARSSAARIIDAADHFCASYEFRTAHRSGTAPRLATVSNSSPPDAWAVLRGEVALPPPAVPRFHGVVSRLKSVLGR